MKGFSNPRVVFKAIPQGGHSDCRRLVDKFTAIPTALSKAQDQLQPKIVNPDSAIDFSDIAACIDAFTGGSYPFEGPDVCQ